MILKEHDERFLEWVQLAQDRLQLMSVKRTKSLNRLSEHQISKKDYAPYLWEET